MSLSKRSMILHAAIGGLAVLSCAVFAMARPPTAEPFSITDSQFGVGFEADHHGADAEGPGLQSAADHIISFQCLDGGWGWPHTACPTTTFSNITGPIGLGLLQIWNVTGDAGTLAGAVAGGDFDVAAVFPNATPSFGSFAPGFLHTLTGATGDGSYSTHAATGFFDRLTAGIYGDPTVSGGSFFPGDTFDFLDRHKFLRTGTWVNLRPWDMQYMPWVAGLIGNADSTTPPDGVSQQTTFLNDAVLAGLNTLDNTAPATVFSDLIGLAGGVRGLALNGTTTFPAISAPLHAPINGITTLCDLADVLAGFQNPDGSWFWHSDLALLGGATLSDEDTQTTAYAVLALEAADVAGCIEVPGGRYTSEIAAGRAWLATMQDVDGGFFSWPGGTHNIEAESEAAHAVTINALSLNTSACSTTGTVTVTIDMSAMPDDIVGGQFFLDFDVTKLTFVSADPGGGTFDVEVFEVVGAGTIAYAVGVTGGGPGTSFPETMAILTFTSVEFCTPTADLVTWDRTHVPPTRLTNDIGDEFLPTLSDLGAIVVDVTDPVITCPADSSVNADAGGCDAVVTFTAPTATDNCDPSPTVVCVPPSGSVFPAGPTLVTCTATDACGNSSECTFTVTVDSVNAFSVVVELESIFETSITRCITFEFWKCPDTAPVATVEADITFAVGIGAATIEIPCGDYECVTARDALHTLRQTDLDHFGISGTEYVADFTSAGDGDALVGGNLNDDFFVDILDFGIFVGQFGTTVGSDTLCPPVGTHADISGNGVVFSEDFTFITTNFLESHEANCCGAPLAMGSPSGRTLQFAPQPVTRISIAQLQRRGLGHLAIADLNHDGWLDLQDVQAFANGARP